MNANMQICYAIIRIFVDWHKIRIIRMKSKVSIIKGEDRYQNIVDSLNLIKDDIEERIKDKKRVLIKPNFLYDDKPSATTNAQAVKAVIDVINQFTDQQITLAEAPFSGTVESAIKNFGYDQELTGYNINYLDLNNESVEEIKVSITKDKSVKLKIAKPILASDFLISVCPPKTHDAVIVTLGIKNLIVGSIIAKAATPGHNWRGEIHESYWETNKILFELLKIIPPHLVVVDAWQGMEGDGPSHGPMVEMKLALASLEPVALDLVMTYLMGFNPNDVGYLYLANQAGLGTNDLSKIELAGNTDLESVRKKFKPHPDYKKQLEWKNEMG